MMDKVCYVDIKIHLWYFVHLLVFIVFCALIGIYFILRMPGVHGGIIEKYCGVNGSGLVEMVLVVVMRGCSNGDSKWRFGRRVPTAS